MLYLLQMKRLFLASSIETTGPKIGEETGDPKKLKLAFIDTAAEPEVGDKTWLRNDRNGLLNAGFKIFDYTITGKSPSNIQADLENFDVIHVNGGNTFYLLLQARKSGFDIWIRDQVLTGKKIYLGSSAGSIAASPNAMDSKFFENYTFDKDLKTFEGFDLVNFIIFPHWGSKYFRKQYLGRRLEIAYKPENKIILLNDWQYIKVVGDVYKIVDIRDE